MHVTAPSYKDTEYMPLSQPRSQLTAKKAVGLNTGAEGVADTGLLLAPWEEAWGEEVVVLALKPRAASGVTSVLELC